MSPQQPERTPESHERLDDLDLVADEATDVEGGETGRTLDAILSTVTDSL